MSSVLSLVLNDSFKPKPGLNSIRAKIVTPVLSLVKNLNLDL